VRVLDVRDLSYEVWRNLVKLYLGDPLTHVYLMYDLLYELENTEFYFAVEDGEVKGYLLVWRGPRNLGIHLWGKAIELLEHLPKGSEAVVHIYDEDLLKPTLERLGETASVRTFLDMVVDESDFRPYEGVNVVRLRPDDEEHVRKFIDVKKAQGRGVDESLARAMLSRFRYYGVFEDGLLASIACAYLRTKDVWIIGDVYTRPEYRGRGFAKAATSAITKDAVFSGAKALLHVASDNTPAIRVYRSLGYRVRSNKYWIFYRPA